MDKRAVVSVVIAVALACFVVLLLQRPSPVGLTLSIEKVEIDSKFLNMTIYFKDCPEEGVSLHGFQVGKARKDFSPITLHEGDSLTLSIDHNGTAQNHFPFTAVLIGSNRSFPIRTEEGAEFDF